MDACKRCWRDLEEMTDLVESMSDSILRLDLAGGLGRHGDEDREYLLEQALDLASWEALIPWEKAFIPALRDDSDE